MYEASFQLQRRPFSATPDPSCVYRPQPVQTVIDEIVICLERGEGIALLTAQAGLGKTLICEKVREELGAGFVSLLLRHSQFQTPADLFRTLLTELGGVIGRTATEQELRLELVAQLTELRRQNQLLVILCDEAHELGETLLDEFRRLVDHADHGVPWVRVLLCGQLELEERLAEARLSALNQRLRAHVTLASLTTQEAWDYIDYRITWAGGRTEEVFHPDTIAAMIEASDGVPRCLNQLCDHVLLLSYVADRKPAPPELVAEALADLQHLPLSWNIRTTRTAESQSMSDSAFETEYSAKEPAAPAVEFGDHLTAWQSTPTFSAGDRDMHPADADVWEFGSEDLGTSYLSTEDAETPEFASPIADTQVIDPVGNFLQAVEAEVERIEQERERAMRAAGGVTEEPVLDRYAAIDGGWPTTDIPREPAKVAEWFEDIGPMPSRVAASMETVHRADVASATPPSPLSSHESSLEQRLSDQVLELVSTTQESLGGRRIDEGRMAATSTWNAELAESVESAPPAMSPGRPFRNLFTRLRRKQKGLE